MTGVPVRIWTLATVLAIILILGLGWLIGVSPLLAQAATADTDRELVEQQNQLALLSLQQLQADNERLPELQAELDELSAEFPDSVEYEAVIDELIGELGDAGLELSQLSISEPFVFLADGAEDPGDGTIPAGTLLEVGVSVSVLGPADAVLAYVEGIQLSARFAVVDTVSFSGGDAPSTSINLRVYVIASETLTPGVVDEAPTEDAPVEGEAPAEGETDGEPTDGETTDEAPAEG